MVALFTKDFSAKLGVGQLTSGSIIIADMTYYWPMQQLKGPQCMADDTLEQRLALNRDPLVDIGPLAHGEV